MTKLIIHPGLRYPEPTTVTLERKPAAWGYTTQQVADLMQISFDAARARLTRAGLAQALSDNGRPVALWHKQSVDKVIAQALPRMHAIPEGYVTTKDAMSLLNMAQTTFRKKAPPCRKILLITGEVTRERNIYLLTDILKLNTQTGK